MGKFLYLTGQRFTRLVVVSRAESAGKEVRWNVACDCGAATIVGTGALRSGNTKSCGCLRKERIAAGCGTTHGKSGTKLYGLWTDIKKRTQNRNFGQYKDYGGRGITMHPEWIGNFEAFETYMLENLGERPEGMSLDRKDNDGNYEPENLRWATRREQMHNVRKNVWVEHEGAYLIMADLARKLGMNRETLREQVLAGKFKLREERR